MSSDESRYRMQDPYSAEGARERRVKRVPAIVVSVLVVVALVAFAGWNVWDSLRGPGFGSYADQQITVSGIQEESLAITPEDLAQLACVSQDVSGQGKAGTEKDVTAYGPLLSTFLEVHGCTPEDFKRVVITCKDGYTLVITPDMLTQEVIMSISQGKEPLEEWQQPLRMVIPSEESGKWAYGVADMVFER